MGAYGDIAPPDSLRLCFRLPGEPRDERPVLLIREFWRSPEEASAYLSAVRNHPREVDPSRDEIESSVAYVARLAGIVAQGPLPKPAKPMPPVRRIVVEQGLKFEEPYEERLEAIYERVPGEDDE